MLPINSYPALVNALPYATEQPHRRLHYIKDTSHSLKTKTIVEKRYKAFTLLVLPWIISNVFIGTKNQEAIYLVTYFHEVYVQQCQGALSAELSDVKSDLATALDYFEALMGHSFKLL